jgi:hypothetical protein
MSQGMTIKYLKVFRPLAKLKPPHPLPAEWAEETSGFRSQLPFLVSMARGSLTVPIAREF